MRAPARSSHGLWNAGVVAWLQCIRATPLGTQRMNIEPRRELDVATEPLVVRVRSGPREPCVGSVLIACRASHTMPCTRSRRERPPARRHGWDGQVGDCASRCPSPTLTVDAMTDETGRGTMRARRHTEGVRDLSTGEAAHRLGLSPHTVRRLVHAGALVPSARTPGGYLRFAPATVEAYVRTRTITATAAPALTPRTADERLRRVYHALASGVVVLDPALHHGRSYFPRDVASRIM